MSFPKYEHYKDSGVEWLGEVPAHWVVNSLGRISTERCDGPFGSGITSDHYTESGAQVVRLQNIKAAGYYHGEPAFIDLGYFEKSLFRHSVEPEDLLIAGLGDENNLVGRACVAPEGIAPALVKADCFRFRLNRSVVSPGFIAFQLCISAECDGGRISTGSTRSRIPLSVMASRKVALPSLEEQYEILSFLTHETTKLDALITEQRTLIDLLKEKRQAVISHAVTKGLDPRVPMKDSGVEWLGEVPAHWEPVRLKNVFRFEKRQGFVDKEVLSVYRDFGVIRKSSRTDNFNKTPDDLSSYQLVMPEDLVVNKMKAWQGSLGISNFEGITSPDYIVFSPIKRNSSRYLHHLLRSHALVGTYLAISNGIRTAQWRLESDSFLNIVIFLPPVGDQYLISDHIDDILLRYDALALEAETTIALLQERRSALISAAVTGKIDVRQAA